MDGTVNNLNGDLSKRDSDFRGCETENEEPAEADAPQGFSPGAEAGARASALEIRGEHFD
jgi:hypothetical protein